MEQHDLDVDIEIESHPCPRCGGRGSVDFFDLIRGKASLHCHSCPTAWSVATDAPLAHLAD